jgi:hypothetical protein
MKRVFHPKSNAFQDVPDGDVEKWAKAGWLKKPHDGIDESESAGVGSWAPVGVPREPVFIEPAPSTREPVAKAVEPAPATPAKADSK